MDLKITSKGSEKEYQRNVKILALLAEGLTAKDIGKQMDLSDRTIETYVDKMMFNNDCRNRIHLITMAHRENIIE